MVRDSNKNALKSLEGLTQNLGLTPFVVKGGLSQI